MQIEALDEATFAKFLTSHMDLTQAALIEVAGKSEKDASHLVRGLQSKFRDAPRQERNWLLHNDPVSLACDLADLNWSDLDKSKLERFNARRKAMTAAQ